MASTLTYALFATHLPNLANVAYTTQIETFIEQAELIVPRAVFGETVPATSTISRADLAVLLMAGHAFELFLRALAAKGLNSPGQVLSHDDGQNAVSYGKIVSENSGDAALAATASGSRYLTLRGTIARVALPMVIC